RGGSYFNAGQDCAQPCRLLVTPKIYDRVVAVIDSAVGTIKAGAPRDEGTEMGPLVSAAHRDRVAGMVSRAQAEAVVGGKAIEGAGFFYAPTVLADVDNRAEAATDEIFGPVVTISRVADEDD